MEHTYKVLSPKEFSGSIYGDFGYEIDGVRSKNGYVSRNGAKSALFRKIGQI